MKNTLKHQSGFTIVELMIATAVFSVVLMLCSMAIIYIGKVYYRGMITNRTQDTARRVIEDVAQTVQFGPASDFRAENHSPIETICIGLVRYTFRKDVAVGNGSAHVLWRDLYPGTNDCPPVALNDASLSNGQEFLGKNMRLPEFSVSSGSTWRVVVRVSYGEASDFTDGTFSTCRGLDSGGQFCATSKLETAVVKRL